MQAFMSTEKLKQRQLKIQEKRKKTEWRDFLMEIASWMPMSFHKVQGGGISRFPVQERAGNTLSQKEYLNASFDEWQRTWEFFNNFTDLFRKNPKIRVQQRFENENSSYAECYWAKNCYLSFAIWQNAENILYSTNSHTNISNIVSSMWVVGNCQYIYQSKIVTESYMVFYALNIHNSNNIWFSANLLWCSECLFCTNLQNASYCIENKQYSKEEYLQKKEKLLRQKNIFDNWYHKICLISPKNILCENVTGSGMVSSSYIENWYLTVQVNHARNLYIWWWKYGWSHFYDSFDVWNQTDEHLYATHYIWESSSHVYCVSWWAWITNCYYWYYLENCSFCLWCIWLKNKSYCIFNKQYTKDERYDEVDKIFTQMEKDWQLWKFFPWSTNPFYFNDTAAYLIDSSFTKEEVTAKWYLWRDEPIKVDIPAWMTVVKTSELDQYEWFDNEWNWIINADILKVVIQDEQHNYYRIIQMEYDFLVKHGLPLPRKHWLERMKDNFKIA